MAGKGRGLLARHRSAAQVEGVEPGTPPCAAQGAVSSVSFRPDVNDSRDPREMLRRGSEEGSPPHGAASRPPVVSERDRLPSARSMEKTSWEIHLEAEATLIPPAMSKPPRAREYRGPEASPSRKPLTG